MTGFLQHLCLTQLCLSVLAALPPGYEDELFCPPNYCKESRNQIPGLVGPASSFYHCVSQDEPENHQPVLTWGTLSNGKKYLNLLFSIGYHPQTCKQMAEGVRFDPCTVYDNQWYGWSSTDNVGPSIQGVSDEFFCPKGFCKEVENIELGCSIGPPSLPYYKCISPSPVIREDGPFQTTTAVTHWGKDMIRGENKSKPREYLSELIEEGYHSLTCKDFADGIVFNPNVIQDRYYSKHAAGDTGSRNQEDLQPPQKAKFLEKEASAPETSGAGFIVTDQVVVGETGGVHKHYHSVALVLAAGFCTAILLAVGFTIVRVLVPSKDECGEKKSS